MSSRPDDHEAPPTALATRQTSIASTTISPSIGGRSLSEMKSWLHELNAFTIDVLKEGVDYGTEPGIPEKFLHKPGSEKLCLLYGLVPEFHEIPQDTIRDWSANPPLIQYAFKCVLIHRATGMKAGEGSGICSTWESKYRYRAEWWNKDGEPPAGEGWKKTKNGYRKQTANPDIADSINTVLKMAQKRAQVDAVLRTTATSMFFKQELDDVQRGEDREREQPKEDPAITKKVTEAIAKIAACAALPELEALAAEIAADPVLSRKHGKNNPNPVRTAYAKRNEELGGGKKKADAKGKPPMDTKPAGESAGEKPKDPQAAPAQGSLPGVEPDPTGTTDDGESFEDPGPDA